MAAHNNASGDWRAIVLPDPQSPEALYLAGALQSPLAVAMPMEIYDRLFTLGWCDDFFAKNFSRKTVLVWLAHIEIGHAFPGYPKRVRIDDPLANDFSPTGNAVLDHFISRVSYFEFKGTKGAIEASR